METNSNKKKTPKNHYSNNALRIFETEYVDGEKKEINWNKCKAKYRANKILTSAEFNVFNCIMNNKKKYDYSPKEVAGKLNLNPRTIERTVDNLMLKGFVMRYQRNKVGNKIYYNYRFAANPIYIEENKDMIESILKRKQSNDKRNKNIEKSIQELKTEQKIEFQKDNSLVKEKEIQKFIQKQKDFPKEIRQKAQTKMLNIIEETQNEAEDLFNKGKINEMLDKQKEINPALLEEKAIEILNELKIN
jgi:predicted transcriptional regulator